MTVYFALSVVLVKTSQKLHFRGKLTWLVEKHQEAADLVSSVVKPFAKKESNNKCSKDIYPVESSIK
jgi:hypothetical protein